MPLNTIFHNVLTKNSASYQDFFNTKSLKSKKKDKIVNNLFQRSFVPYKVAIPVVILL